MANIKAAKQFVQQWQGKYMSESGLAAALMKIYQELVQTQSIS